MGRAHSSPQASPCYCEAQGGAWLLGALPQAVAEVGKKLPPAPEPTQPCREGPRVSLVMGCLRDWGGKQVAGAVDKREVTGGREGEICTPRAPSPPPWDQAKHRRAPVGRPYPWPPPTHQKPEPEGQRGFMSRHVLKNFPRFPKNKPAGSLESETEHFSTRALRAEQ